MTVGFAGIVGYTTVARHADTKDLAVPLEAFEEGASGPW